MKTLTLAAALAATLAAPAAFANDQLAASVGAAPGQFTVSELIQLRDAIDSNDYDTERFIRSGAATNPVSAATVGAIQLGHALEDDDHDYARYLENGGSEVISTQSFGHNAVAAEIFERLAQEAREDRG